MSLVSNPPILQSRLCVAELTDVSIIADVVTGAFFEKEPFRNEYCPRLTEESVKKSLRQKGREWYLLKQGWKVSEDNEMYWKTVATVFYEKKSPLVGHIHMLSKRVTECFTEARFKGCGAKLLGLVEKTVKQSRIVLWCVDGSLSQYYEKLGYSKSGNVSQYAPAYVKEEFKGKIQICEMFKQIRFNIPVFFSRVLDIQNITRISFTQIASKHTKNFISLLDYQVSLQSIALPDTDFEEDLLMLFYKKIAGLKSLNQLTLSKNTVSLGMKKGKFFLEAQVEELN